MVARSTMGLVVLWTLLGVSPGEAATARETRLVPSWSDVFALQASQSAPAQEFVPIDELPPEERLPAARLLIAAYVVAWLVPLAYLWGLWRRLARVEKDLGDLERNRREPNRS